MLVVTNWPSPMEVRILINQDLWVPGVVAADVVEAIKIAAHTVRDLHHLSPPSTQALR